MSGGWRKNRGFDKPAPEGWVPRRGETVYVARIQGTLGMLVSTGVVLSVADDLVRVKVSYGRQTTMDQWLLAELRPRRGDGDLFDRPNISTV